MHQGSAGPAWGPRPSSHEPDDGCLVGTLLLTPFPSSLLPSVTISPLYQQQVSFPESGQAKYPANFDPDIKGGIILLPSTFP